MAKILVHVTHGPENPTRAALAFSSWQRAPLMRGTRLRYFWRAMPFNSSEMQCSTTSWDWARADSTFPGGSETI